MRENEQMKKESKEQRKDIILGQKYKLGTKLGAGSFGEIYNGENIKNRTSVAMKLEETNPGRPSRLNVEAKIYRSLAGEPGIPRIYWIGYEGEFNIMVMELLGPSLEELLILCERKFSIRTVVMLADQLITRVEFLHSHGFIHRDIKPENFCIGKGHKSDTMQMIDFGLAKRYRDPKTKIHIPYRDGKKLAGTARYASVNTHIGIDQSRRDDLESLSYIFIYCLKGELPWMGVRAYTRKEKYEKIMEKKMSIPVETLCKGYPTFMYYCKNLKFEDKPDYVYCKKLFKDLFNRQEFYKDFVWDWNVIQKAKSKKKRNRKWFNKKAIENSPGSSNEDERDRVITQLKRKKSSMDMEGSEDVSSNEKQPQSPSRKREPEAGINLMVVQNPLKNEAGIWDASAKQRNLGRSDTFSGNIPKIVEPVIRSNTMKRRPKASKSSDLLPNKDILDADKHKIVILDKVEEEHKGESNSSYGSVACIESPKKRNYLSIPKSSNYEELSNIAVDNNSMSFEFEKMGSFGKSEDTSSMHDSSLVREDISGEDVYIPEEKIDGEMGCIPMGFFGQNNQEHLIKHGRGIDGISPAYRKLIEET